MKATIAAAAAEVSATSNQTARGTSPKRLCRLRRNTASQRTKHSAATQKALEGFVERGNGFALIDEIGGIPKEQEPTKSNNECRYIGISHQRALNCADDGPSGEHRGQRQPPGLGIVDMQQARLGHRARDAEKSKHRANRKVYLARYDQQDHPGRHYCDYRDLDRQVVKVARGEECSACERLKDDPDKA